MTDCPPMRVLAYIDDATVPSWWVTIDNGRTYYEAGNWRHVTADRLTVEACGYNDVHLTAQFPRSRRAAFQKPRHG